LGEKWTKWTILHGTLLHHPPREWCKNFWVWTCYESCSVGFCWKLMLNMGWLVPCRIPMAESWDSVETVSLCIFSSSWAGNGKFMNETKSWLKLVIKVDLGFALQCDMSRHWNDLNTKFHSQQKLSSDMFGAVRFFEMKLKLFRKQSENINLCCFSDQ
jgi:hypothetical protein